MTVTHKFTEIKTNNASAYTSTASISLVAGRIYILAVESRTTGTPADATISGTAGAWTTIQGNTFFGNAAADSRHTVYRYVPAANEGPLTITATFGGGQTHCTLSCLEVTGQHTTTPIAQTGYKNLDAGTATSINPATASAPAAGSTMVAFMIHYGVSENVAPDGNYTEDGEAQGSAFGGTAGGDLTTVESEHRLAGQQTCTATWATASRGSAYNIEVAAAGAGPSITYANVERPMGRGLGRGLGDRT